MKAIISKTSNGAWLRFTDKEAEIGERERDSSYQFDTGKDENDIAGAIEMFYDILDWMCWIGDRRDRRRIRISIVHGDKYECSDASCDICNDYKEVKREP